MASKVRDVSPSLGSGAASRASLCRRASANHLRVAGLVLLVRAAWVWIRAWISAFASGEVSGGSTSASSNTASRVMMCPTSGRLGSPAADVTQRAHATARDTSRSMLPLYLFPVWTVSSATQPAPLISVKVLYTIARSEQHMSRIVETDRDGHDLQ